MPFSQKESTSGKKLESNLIVRLSEATNLPIPSTLVENTPHANRDDAAEVSFLVVQYLKLVHPNEERRSRADSNRARRKFLDSHEKLDRKAKFAPAQLTDEVVSFIWRYRKKDRDCLKPEWGIDFTVFYSKIGGLEGGASFADPKVENL